jgi:hypothetical protein
MDRSIHPSIPGSSFLVCAHESEFESLEKESLRPYADEFGLPPAEGTITRPIESITSATEATAEEEEEEEEEEEII